MADAKTAEHQFYPDGSRGSEQVARDVIKQNRWDHTWPENHEGLTVVITSAIEQAIAQGKREGVEAVRIKLQDLFGRRQLEERKRHDPKLAEAFRQCWVICAELDPAQVIADMEKTNG